MTVDLGLLLGITGTLLGGGSLAYARVQALQAQRQADAAVSVALAQVKEATAVRRRDAGNSLFEHARFVDEWREANPASGLLIEKLGGMGALLALREFFAAMQVSYNLRREGILDDPEWRMTASVAKDLFAMPSVREYFELSERAGRFDKSFLDAFRPAMERQEPRDPSPPRRRLVT
jgi:hypothetical protein